MSLQPNSMTDEIVFRKTNTHVGRHISVSPSNSPNKHLAYGRIILNSATPQVSFSNGTRETGLIGLSGKADITCGSDNFHLRQYDSVYIPRDSQIEVKTHTQTDIAEFTAEVEHRYPTQLISNQQASKDPKLHLAIGGSASKRDVNILIGSNVQAGRLLVGFTISECGNWTSWPPHEHGKMLEEIYVYFEMPAPAFGIQLVFNNTEYPDFVTVVRDGDAVLIPAGYHPNVSVPGHRIGFLWAMAAHREVEDRQYGVVNVQPGFQQGGSGLDAARR